MLSNKVKIFSSDSTEYLNGRDYNYNPFHSRSFTTIKGIHNHKKCLMVVKLFNEFLEEWEQINIPFTYWGSEKLTTPEQALTFFKDCAKLLYKLSKKLDLDSQERNNYKQALEFNKYYNIGDHVYTLSNIDNLASDCYVFYSCYKLLDYMFIKNNIHNSSEYSVFEDEHDFLNFLYNAGCENEKL